MANARTHRDYKVAIISALWFETAAMLGMLEETHPRLPLQPGDNNSYSLGTVERHNVVLVCLPGTMGNTAASNTSTNLLRTFPSIKTVLLVGIGGGVAGSSEESILARDLRLGDVVVAMPTNGTGHGVVEYDLGRHTTHGFERKGFLQPSPQLLRSVANTMRMDPDLPKRVAANIESMKDDEKEFQRPDAGTDVLFFTDAAKAGWFSAPKPMPLQRPARHHPQRPKIHYGLIATGDSVVKTIESQEEFVQRLAQEGETLCFEMEAAGVATSTSCFVIRGICDYSDSHKNKVWQRYAAAAAAGYAKVMLRNLDPGEVGQEPSMLESREKGVEGESQNQNAGPEMTGFGGNTTIHQGKGYIIGGGTNTFGDVAFN